MDVTERVRSRKELEEAKQEADRANNLKSAFLANMSHEIRTPLGAILGFADILRTSKVSKGERTKYIDVISRNGHALTKIIDDILDLSKIEAGKLDLEITPVCLTDLTREVILMFSDRAAKKGIDLKFDSKNLPNFRIDSDPIRIRQVLVNLLGNAIKFTGQGGIEVRGEYSSLSEDQFRIVFRVIDTGIGMSSTNASRLFTPFTQIDNGSSRQFGGTGLGLALSKRLGKALGGDVSIESSEENKGSTFKFEIIAKRSSSFNVENSLSSAHAGDIERDLKGLQVLVVDDSPDNRSLIELYLKRKGAKVAQADDGEDGVTKALAGNFDVVLMDIQMPGMDGYEALSKLRYQGFTSPVIALTAHAMKEERMRSLMSGFSDHVTKPVNLRELTNVIVVHAGRH